MLPLKRANYKLSIKNAMRISLRLILISRYDMQFHFSRNYAKITIWSFYKAFQVFKNCKLA
jgi:hypothetical protein